MGNLDIHLLAIRHVPDYQSAHQDSLLYRLYDTLTLQPHGNRPYATVDAAINIVKTQRYASGVQILWSDTADTDSLCRSIATHALWQISNGHVMNKGTVLALIHCRLPCQIFTNNNFVATEHKLVFTEADPDLRRVNEFNAEPAAIAYARAIGISIDELDAGSFASHSVIGLIIHPHPCCRNCHSAWTYRQGTTTSGPAGQATPQGMHAQRRTPESR